MDESFLSNVEPEFLEEKFGWAIAAGVNFFWADVWRMRFTPGM
ncbi:hypothetical protein [Nostoc sp. C052]|nr:hypothetical protein [Nostoc sp. C052]